MSFQPGPTQSRLYNLRSDQEAFGYESKICGDNKNTNLHPCFARLGKRELICLLLFTCNCGVSIWRGFLFLWVLGMGYVILLWHSLSLSYNYFAHAKSGFSHDKVHFFCKQYKFIDNDIY